MIHISIGFIYTFVTYFTKVGVLRDSHNRFLPAALSEAEGLRHLRPQMTLQGHLRSCLTILYSARRLLSKNVMHDLVRPQRPELEAEMSVFNLAQKRSFSPLCAKSQQVQLGECRT
jgi:hypothetical protein